MLRKIKTALLLLLSWLAYPLSFFVPRSKKIWIFVGWYKDAERETFADNAKYVFLHTTQNYPEITSVWIAEDEEICKILRERGYLAHSIYSLSGIYYSLRAGYTVIDAVMKLPNWRYSSGSKTIQLWHADGIKKLTQTSRWRWNNAWKIFNQPGPFKRFYFLIASSNYIAKKFMAPSFDVETSDVRITGLPRYDTFFRKVKDSDIDIHADLGRTLKEIASEKPNRLVLYAPTFRRGRSVPDQLAHINLDILNSWLLKKNYFLVISLHPKFSASSWEPSATHSNIRYLNAGKDFYPFLKEFDILVTDYSSTCIEFLLMNKPTIFFVYDIEEYRKNEGLAEEFWGYMPGLRVKDYNELTKALEEPLGSLKKDHEAVRSVIFEYTDGNCSERVVREILKG